MCTAHCRVREQSCITSSIVSISLAMFHLLRLQPKQTILLGLRLGLVSRHQHPDIPGEGVPFALGFRVKGFFHVIHEWDQSVQCQ